MFLPKGDLNVCQTHESSLFGGKIVKILHTKAPTQTFREMTCVLLTNPLRDEKIRHNKQRFSKFIMRRRFNEFQIIVIFESCLSIAFVLQFVCVLEASNTIERS